MIQKQIVTTEKEITQPFTVAALNYEILINKGRLSPNTKAAYRTSISQLLAFSGSREITPTIITDWLNELSAGYSNNTLNVRRAAIIYIVKQVALIARSRFAPTMEDAHVRSEILNRVELIKSIPSFKVKGVKLGEWLTYEQTAVLLKSVPEKYTFLTKLIIATGLRVGEAIAIDKHDFLERDGRLVLNIEGKGDKFRIVPVPPWLKVPEDFNSFAFSRGAFAKMLLTKCWKLFDKKITPHDLRRTAGRLWYKAKPSTIYEISQLFGHSSITVTEKYIGVTVNLENSVNDLVVF